MIHLAYMNRFYSISFLSLLWLLLFAGQSDAVLQRISLIHTTDIHGWVNGHRHEPQFAANMGDFVSFIKHEKDRWSSMNVDTHVFDTGDLIQGTGLSDATTIDGQFIYDLMKDVPYDALCIGNHDLADDAQIQYMRDTFVPYWNGHYLAMNVFYNDPTHGKIAFSEGWYSFNTSLGMKVLVMGFLYDFDDHPDLVEVETVAETVTKSVFLDAMNEPNVELIYVLGHFDYKSEEVSTIHDAIRARTQVPLVMLTGHSHQMHWLPDADDNCLILESWWAFKTVGLLQFTVDTNNKSFLNFSHDFVDTTVEEFRTETQVPEPEPFDTPDGINIEKKLNATFDALKLDTPIGYLPFTWKKNELISVNDSVYRFLLYHMYPDVVFSDTLPNPTNYLLNTGSVRANLYEGTVIVDDLFVIDPFNSTFKYVAGVNGTLVMAVKDRLSPWSSTAPRNDDDNLSVTGRVPHYYLSTYPPVDETVYNLMTTDYDSTRVVDTLKELTGLDTWEAKPYPTQLSSTQALRIYIEKEYPYSSSSVAPHNRDDSSSGGGLSWLEITGIVIASLVACCVICLILGMLVGCTVYSKITTTVRSKKRKDWGTATAGAPLASSAEDATAQLSHSYETLDEEGAQNGDAIGGEIDGDEDNEGGSHGFGGSGGLMVEDISANSAPIPSSYEAFE